MHGRAFKTPRGLAVGFALGCIQLLALAAIGACNGDDTVNPAPVEASADALKDVARSDALDAGADGPRHDVGTDALDAPPDTREQSDGEPGRD